MDYSVGFVTLLSVITATSVLKIPQTSSVSFGDIVSFRAIEVPLWTPKSPIRMAAIDAEWIKNEREFVVEQREILQTQLTAVTNILPRIENGEVTVKGLEKRLVAREITPEIFAVLRKQVDNPIIVSDIEVKFSISRSLLEENLTRERLFEIQRRLYDAFIARDVSASDLTLFEAQIDNRFRKISDLKAAAVIKTKARLIKRYETKISVIFHPIMMKYDPVTIQREMELRDILFDWMNTEGMPTSEMTKEMDDMIELYREK